MNSESEFSNADTVKTERRKFIPKNYQLIDSNPQLLIAKSIPWDAYLCFYASFFVQICVINSIFTEYRKDNATTSGGERIKLFPYCTAAIFACFVVVSL